MILPDSSSGTPHELVGGGKDGKIIVLNRDSLGHENSTDKAIQEVKTGVGAIQQHLQLARVLEQHSLLSPGKRYAASVHLRPDDGTNRLLLR